MNANRLDTPYVNLVYSTNTPLTSLVQVMNGWFEEDVEEKHDEEERINREIYMDKHPALYIYMSPPIYVITRKGEIASDES